MNFLPIFTNYFPKNTILLAMVLFLCIPSSFSADKYEDEPIIGCDGDLLEHNATITGARRKEWTEINHDLDKLKIPEKFDAREQWPNCKSIQTILYQGKCGGCWAFASGSVMSDRLCIASKGRFNQLLSIQDILECCIDCVTQEGVPHLGGCKGGYSELSFLFWKVKGVVTGGGTGCKPLSELIRFGVPVTQCRTTCTGFNFLKSYKDDKIFAIEAIAKTEYKKNNIKHIQAEIMLNGPVTAGMDVYDYVEQVREKNTILKYEESKVKKEPTGHAIKIIGWDVIDGVPVWIIANSWGRNWCNEGFCYIRRGYNDFKIENERMISAGIAKFSDKSFRLEDLFKSTSARFRITGDEYFFKVVLMLNVFLF